MLPRRVSDVLINRQTEDQGQDVVVHSHSHAAAIRHRFVHRRAAGRRRTGGEVATAVDAVEAEVRELVRRRGLDPVEDRVEMRRLIDEVVSDYDERALTSALPPLSDSRSAARAVYDAVAGFGPLQRHLDDPTVEEIWINERLTG